MSEVISLKKFLDRPQPPAEGEFSQTVLAAYCNSLSAMADSSVDACPPVGAALRESLLALQTVLSANPTAETIAVTGPRVQAELKQWGSGAADYFKKRANEAKEVMIILAQSAEVIGERDQRYVSQLHEFTVRLESMAGLEDLAAIRDQLVKSAGDLKASTEAMADESRKSLTQLRLDVVGYQQRLEHAEEKAGIDPLTALANRRRVESALDLRTRSDAVFSIAILDLNGFKQVNDTHGHSAGDELLTQFATELRSACRPADTIGRWGGDEFIVVLDCALAEATSRMQRIADWVFGEYTIHAGESTHKVQVAAAYGVSDRQPGDTAQAILERADAAMYAHKKSARDAPLAPGINPGIPPAKPR